MVLGLRPHYWYVGSSQTWLATLGTVQMNFELDMDDYAIILNALHYYKKVEKRGNFKQYDVDRINMLRDKMAYQLVPSADSMR